MQRRIYAKFRDLEFDRDRLWDIFERVEHVMDRETESWQPRRSVHVSDESGETQYEDLREARAEVRESRVDLRRIMIMYLGQDRRSAVVTVDVQNPKGFSRVTVKSPSEVEAAGLAQVVSDTVRRLAASRAGNEQSAASTEALAKSPLADVTAAAPNVGSPPASPSVPTTFSRKPRIPSGLRRWLSAVSVEVFGGILVAAIVAAAVAGWAIFWR